MPDLYGMLTGKKRLFFSNGGTEVADVKQVLTDSGANLVALLGRNGTVYNWKNVVSVHDYVPVHDWPPPMKKKDD